MHATRAGSDCSCPVGRDRLLVVSDSECRLIRSVPENITQKGVNICRTEAVPFTVYSVAHTVTRSGAHLVALCGVSDYQSRELPCNLAVFRLEAPSDAHIIQATVSVASKEDFPNHPVFSGTHNLGTLVTRAHFLRCVAPVIVENRSLCFVREQIPTPHSPPPPPPPYTLALTCLTSSPAMFPVRRTAPTPSAFRLSSKKATRDSWS